MTKFCKLLDGINAIPEKYPQSALSGRHLDICLGQLAISRHSRDRCHFFMTLLAYAALNSQKEMVDLLVERKASKYSCMCIILCSKVGLC